MRFYKPCFWCILLFCSLALTACNRRTPEERLAKAVEFYQQNDSLSAEVEARKIIEKAPEDPAAIQARMLLAQIYVRDNRMDEAIAEIEPALQKVSQKEDFGRRVLSMYLELLQRQKKYPEALKVVDKYQKDYADDEATSLNLVVKRADIQILAGETTSAREILSELAAGTTVTAEKALYRNMLARTYQRDGDTTGLVALFEAELQATQDPSQKRPLLTALGEIHAGTGDLQQSRQFTQQATDSFDAALADELDANARTRMLLELGTHYSAVGNLDGARRVFQALFDGELRDAESITATVMGLADVLLRLGEPDAALGFLKEAATRYPTAPFGQHAAQMEAAKAQNRLQELAPADTSTLVLNYRQAGPIAPKNLPKSNLQTTGTLSADSMTTNGAEITSGTTTTSSDTASTSSTDETTTAGAGSADAAESTSAAL